MVVALPVLAACGGQTVTDGSGQDTTQTTYCTTQDGYRFDESTGRVVPDPSNPTSGQVLDPALCNQFAGQGASDDDDGHSSFVIWRTMGGASHSSYTPGTRISGGSRFGLTNSAARTRADLPATGRVSTTGGKSGGFAVGRSGGVSGGSHAGGGKAGGGGHGGG